MRARKSGSSLLIMLRALRSIASVFFLLRGLGACSQGAEAQADLDAGIRRDTAAPKDDTSFAARDAVSDTHEAGAALDAPLPACHWPSSVTPPIPDGSVPGWYVSRAYLICGPCVTNPMESATNGCFHGADNSEAPIGPTPCETVCAPDEYALWSPGRGDPSGLTIISVAPPAGCKSTPEAITALLANPGSSQGPPSVECCPCE